MQSLKSRLFYHLLKRRLAQFRRRNLPLDETRALRDEDSARRFQLPVGIVGEASRIAGLPGEWLRPLNDASGSGIIVYLHGGAYVQGSVQTHRALAARLAMASGATTWLMDYRLAPEHPFPAALDDAYATYAALRAAHLDQPIAIAGDSAGGGLALALALRIRETREILPPAALALLSPWTDLTLSNASHSANAAVDPYFPSLAPLKAASLAYAGSSAHNHPLVSPHFADLTGLPKTLIDVGEFEALLGDSRSLSERMGNRAQLKVWPRMWRVWQMFGGHIRESDQSLAEMGKFLRLNLYDPP